MAQNDISSTRILGRTAENSLTAGERRGEIPAAVDRITNDIEQLASAVDTLITRLEPVLQHPADSAKTGSGLEAAETSPITPMGDRLRSLSYRLSNLRQQVSEASYRLEL